MIVDTVMKLKTGTKMHILAPLIRGRKGVHKSTIDETRKEGFLRIRIDGEVMSIDDKIQLNKNKKHTIEVVIDRLILKDKIHERLTESIELALKIGNGLVIINELYYYSFFVIFIFCLVRHRCCFLKTNTVLP